MDSRSTVRALLVAVIAMGAAGCGDDDPASTDASAGNHPPVISGSPSKTAIVDQNYTFTPKASDADGDTLTFSIQGKPGWMSFDSTTGTMSGTPHGIDVGKHKGIVISVSDGTTETDLQSTDIDVLATANQPPQISGTPPPSVIVDDTYDFTPVVYDPEGDTLSFTVSSLPSWANFDSGTGGVTGTPGAGDLGSYGNITISVSDGIGSDSLEPFSIDVVAFAGGVATLTWTPPTENTDGSALTDLAGYVVYWGQVSGDYAHSVVLDNPGLTSYVVDNLLPGATYYFVATAFNGQGIESGFSNEASKLIN